MKLKPYESYEKYVESQRRTDLLKTGMDSSITQHIVSEIATCIRNTGIPVSRILCHGARCGQEVYWFQVEFPQARSWGTDLFLKGHSNVVQWDFHERKRQWVGRLDIVYSNSLDHSYDPRKALQCWFDQLRLTGMLCLQWSKWHRRAFRGDCFGAELHEYVDLLNEFGIICDEIQHGRSYVTLVAKRKEQ